MTPAVLDSVDGLEIDGTDIRRHLHGVAHTARTSPMKRNDRDNRDSRHDLSNDFVRMLSEDWRW